MTDARRQSGSVFQFLETEQVDSSIHTFGMTERYLAPIAMVDVLQGFGENAWVAAMPSNVLVMRMSGAAVTCRWGRHAGKSTRQSGITFQPAGVRNAYQSDGRIRFARIFLPDRLINRVAGEIWSTALPQGRLREDLIFLSDAELERLYADYLKAALDLVTPLELEARALLITAHLLRAHHGAAAPNATRIGGLAPWQLNRVCEAMQAHLETDITLETLAGLAGISATHFCRAFKKSTGVPPFVWLQRCRIARAKELLADPALPLAQIALATGFAAQPQFTTAFRRETGVTPGAWRRQLLR